jgi:hypothetical protein
MEGPDRNSQEKESCKCESRLPASIRKQAGFFTLFGTPRGITNQVVDDTPYSTKFAVVKQKTFK